MTTGACQTLEDWRVAPGLALPFYPMRPKLGRPLVSLDVACQRLAELLDQGWAVQPKLNGDRACLATLGGRAIIQSRHLGWLSQRVKNAAQWSQALPSGTCLDGEIVDGHFYPFEALAVGGVALTGFPVETRVAIAKVLCLEVGVEWLFATPSLAWVHQHWGTTRWEGFVAKRGQSRYLVRGNDADTDLWLKLKW